MFTRLQSFADGFRRAMARGVRCPAAGGGLVLMLFGIGTGLGDLLPADGFEPDVDGPVLAMVVRSDGRIIVGGNFHRVGGSSKTNVAGLKRDGSLDFDFEATTDGAVRALALQADGKILAGGSFTMVRQAPHPFIARLAPNGTVDDDFQGAADLDVLALVVQPDGKILLGGRFGMLNDRARPFLGRLNPDGTLDASFDPQPNGPIHDIALQPDGRILVAGDFTSLGGETHRRLGRLDPDGTVDPMWEAGADSTVWTVAVQADGKVVVGGSFGELGGAPQEAVGRLSHNGRLDSAFHGGADGPVRCVVVQPDGRILLGGEFAGLNHQAHPALGRLHSDGTLDLSYDSTADKPVLKIVPQPDGNILLAGEFNSIGGTPRNHLARTYPDGSVDSPFEPVFDAAAGVSTAFAREFCWVPQADGKILVGGSFTSVNGVARHYVARVRPDGRLDEAFDAGLPIGNSAVGGLLVQADGKVLVHGLLSPWDGRALIRLHVDGALDDQFNPPAAVQYSNDTLCVALQADGRILVGGFFLNIAGRGETQAVVRLMADGQLDPSFYTTGLDYYGIGAIAEQPDGKILVGGTFQHFNGELRNKIVRLREDGSLDPSFGDAGLSACCAVNSMLVQPDGKVLVGGFFWDARPIRQRAIFRLNRDGTRDVAFDEALGEVPFGSEGRSMSLRVDGKLFLGGHFTQLGGQPHRGIARLNPDGSVDVAFQSQASGDVASFYSEVLSAALEPDGKMLLSGVFTNLDGRPRQHFARLGTVDAASQKLAVTADGTAVNWWRSGAGPEIEQVTFEESLDGTNYFRLGRPGRVSGGWQLAGLALPAGQDFHVRARGRAVASFANGSSGLIESVARFYGIPSPSIVRVGSGEDGQFRFSFTNASWARFTVVATTNAALPSAQWEVLGPARLSEDGFYQFIDPSASNFAARFYQLRWP